MTDNRPVGYIRVSSETQAADDRVSVPQQIENIKRLCDFHDWIIDDDDWFIDKVKYKKTKKPNKGNRVVRK